MWEIRNRERKIKKDVEEEETTGCWLGLSEQVETNSKRRASTSGVRLQQDKIYNTKMENLANFHGLFELKTDSALRMTFGHKILFSPKAFCEILQIVSPSHLGVVTSAPDKNINVLSCRLVMFEDRLTHPICFQQNVIMHSFQMH